MTGSRNIVIAHGLGMVVVAWCMALFARFNFEVPPLPFLASGFKALPIVLIVQGLLLWKFGLYPVYIGDYILGQASNKRIQSAGIKILGQSAC